MLDTHDGSTDRYHFTRSVKQIRKKISSLEPHSSHTEKGGNGVIAWARKK